MNKNELLVITHLFKTSRIFITNTAVSVAHCHRHITLLAVIFFLAIMPNNVEYDEAEVEEMKKYGCLSKSTLKSKELAESHFEKYLAENGTNITNLLENSHKLEDLLVRYFSTYRYGTK